MSVTYLDFKSLFNSRWAKEIKGTKYEALDFVLDKKVFFNANGYSPVLRRYILEDIYDLETQDIEDFKDVEILKPKDGSLNIHNGNLRSRDLGIWNEVFTHYLGFRMGSPTIAPTLKNANFLKSISKSSDIANTKEVNASKVEDKYFHLWNENEQIVNDEELTLRQYLIVLHHGKEKNTFKRILRQEIVIKSNFSNIDIRKHSYSGSGRRGNVIRKDTSLMFETASRFDNAMTLTGIPSNIAIDAKALKENGNKSWIKFADYLLREKTKEDGIYNAYNLYNDIEFYWKNESVLEQIATSPYGDYYGKKNHRLNKRISNGEGSTIAQRLGLTKKLEDKIMNLKESEFYFDSDSDEKMSEIFDDRKVQEMVVLINSISSLRKTHGDVGVDEIFNEELIQKYRDYSNEIINIQDTLGNNYNNRWSVQLNSLPKYIELMDWAKHNNVKIGDFLDYATGMIWTEGFYTLNSLKDYLSDYWRFISVIDGDHKKFPKNLKAEHDKANLKYLFLTKTQGSKLFVNTVKEYADKFKYEDKDWVILPPYTPSDLIAEGQELGHCVGSYVSYVIEGRAIILFLRNKEEVEKSLYTIDIRNKNGQYQIQQIKGKSNKVIPRDSEAYSFVEKWIKKYNMEVVNL